MENEITIYTTTNCPYCNMLKEFFNQNSISYQEVNVENDPSMMQKVVNETGQMGVPQTEIDGQWVIGFDPERLILAMSA